MACKCKVRSHRACSPVLWPFWFSLSVNGLSWYHVYVWLVEEWLTTRKHSSGMCTACLLTVSCCIPCPGVGREGGGVHTHTPGHTHPPEHTHPSPCIYTPPDIPTPLDILISLDMGPQGVLTPRHETSGGVPPPLIHTHTESTWDTFIPTCWQNVWKHYLAATLLARANDCSKRFNVMNINQCKGFGHPWRQTVRGVWLPLANTDCF